MNARWSPPPTPAARGEERGPVAHTGIGLRFPHQQFVVSNRPRVPWFEVHTENYFGGGTRLAALERIRCDYPLSLHGTALSPGGAEGIDRSHLQRVAECVERLQPALISEHLSFSIVDGIYYADLLPLPLTEESLWVVCRNVTQIQEALKRRILIENPSSYLRYSHSVIPEWEFLAALSARTGCGILCDVNNIHVSACNHGWDPHEYLAALPADAVGEIHLAGHAERVIEGRKVLIDNHGSRVSGPVWDLFAAALRRFGPTPALIEWDMDIPEFPVLQDEAAHAEQIAAAVAGAMHADAA